MVTYVKFDNIKIFNYIIVNEYDIKFKNIINKFAIYSFSSKMDENWLIYKYLDDLNSDNVRLFIERWIFEYEFFDNDVKIGFKFVFFDVIYSYEVQCVNLFVKSHEKRVAFFVIKFVVINFRIKKST